MLSVLPFFKFPVSLGVRIPSDAASRLSPAPCVSGVYLFPSENESVKLVSLSEHVTIISPEWRLMEDRQQSLKFIMCFIFSDPLCWMPLESEVAAVLDWIVSFVTVCVYMSLTVQSGFIVLSLPSLCKLMKHWTSEGGWKNNKHWEKNPAPIWCHLAQKVTATV